MSVSKDFSIAAQWTPALAEGKWTPVVDRFLHCYHKLEMTSSEAMVIIHIMSHKWTADLPFPAIGTLSERMGVTETAVRNNLRSLEKKSLLRRLPQKGKANLYDLKPLFKFLELSDAELEKAAQRKMPEN